MSAVFLCKGEEALARKSPCEPDKLAAGDTPQATWSKVTTLLVTLASASRESIPVGGELAGRVAAPLQGLHLREKRG